MSLEPIDRRTLLADAAGGLFLCTLAGHKVFLNKGADVDGLAANVKVPPKVAAAQRREAGAPATSVFVANSPGRREYWIKAEEVSWDIVPSGRDQMMGRKVKGKTKFKAYAYRAYSEGFGAPLGPAQIPGPLIEADVGDTVVIHFQNKLKSPVTIHPHGVQYSDDMDGAYKGRFTDPGGFVQKNDTFDYIWEAIPDSEGAWMYHDHGPLDPLPLYKGLFGPIIVRDPGKPQPTREFFTAFHSFQPVATGLDKPFWCLNGRAYAGKHADAASERRRRRRLLRLRARRQLPHLPPARPSLEEPRRRQGDRQRHPGHRRRDHPRASSRTTLAAGSTTATSSATCIEGMNGWYIVS